MRGLLRLTWLETKIFMREPLGAFGSVGIPVLLYVVLGRMLSPRFPAAAAGNVDVLRIEVPILAALLISINAVLSLVTIVSIYREGGILKRLRATPLGPRTILAAHVLVKLSFTAVTLLLMVLAGKQYYPADLHIPVGSFTAALLIATGSVLSLGFLIASVVPTARFAQPIGAVVLYPMVALSGLFFPIALLPPIVRTAARVLPFTYAVSLLAGILNGEAWSAHLGDVAALAIIAAVCTTLSARLFRWE
ncbi:MAG: ABC transporter permease [Vicinamibacterales bacterium]